MSRLVVNPDTPEAWEIHLKPGENSLGRGEANDFIVQDPSVSGSHCRIVVSDGTASIKDLGSTNGTFINRAQVQEAALQDGQPIRLGSVEMIFHSDAPPPVATAAPVPAVAQTGAPPRPARIRLSNAAPAAVPPPPPRRQWRRRSRQQRPATGFANSIPRLRRGTSATGAIMLSATFA